MGSTSDSTDNGAQCDAELVDVTGLPLLALMHAERDSPVLRSIERLQSNLKDPSGVLSAFNSFIDES